MDVEEIFLRKGRELFALCDRESKGYLSRSDLQRIGQELPLTSQQLGDAFERLDTDGDGRLTFKEFVSGFADHLGGGVTKTDTDHFDALLDHLGARNLLKDEDMVRALWEHLRMQDEQSLVTQFEKFLAKMTKEIKKNQSETSNLQATLKSKMKGYEDQVRKLYEEMECQLKDEKDRIRHEERQREQRIREEFESQLIEKENLVEEMAENQKILESKLESLNSAESDSKISHSQLMREKDALERQLMSSQSSISELQRNLDRMREQSKEEKRRRAKVAVQVSESIALEREELVKQLDLLKVINQQLRDEHDERVSPIPAGHSSMEECDPRSLTTSPVPIKNGHEGSDSAEKGRSRRLVKRGSVMSDYIQTKGPRLGHYASGPDISTSAFSVYQPIQNGLNKSFSGSKTQARSMSTPAINEVPNVPVIPINISTDKGDMSSDTVEVSEDETELWVVDNQTVPVARSPQPTSGRQVIPASTKMIPKTVKQPTDPHRLFKVVFIGDSGVGKSSFIHRVCHNAFRSTFSATIGVDFHTYRVECNGQTVVLQLWDTAGQERFRSITNQYMRKADGIVIMYDVASEYSFKNVRGWLNCVRDFTEIHTQVLLLGNKVDLCPINSIRTVQTSDGMRLAEENGAIFYETSVKTNQGVAEAMQTLANNLQESEDMEIELALQLHLQNTAKKRCCL